MNTLITKYAGKWEVGHRVLPIHLHKHKTHVNELVILPTNAAMEVSLLDGPFKNTYQEGTKTVVEVSNMGKFAAELKFSANSEPCSLRLEFSPLENQNILYLMQLTILKRNRMGIKVFCETLKNGKKRKLSSCTYKRTITCSRKKAIVNFQCVENSLPTVEGTEDDKAVRSTIPNASVSNPTSPGAYLVTFLMMLLLCPVLLL